MLTVQSPAPRRETACLWCLGHSVFHSPGNAEGSLTLEDSQLPLQQWFPRALFNLLSRTSRAAR